MRVRAAGLAFAVAWAAMSASPHAAASEVSADKQALIVLRVLAYDHALGQRADGTVRIAVLHDDSPASLECAGRMRAALGRLVGRLMITGMPLAVYSMSTTDPDPRVMIRARTAVAYVCRGSQAHVRWASKSARSAHVLTFTDQTAYLEDGLSIALTDESSRVGIAVNLVAAQAEGARLGGQLLRLSKVVKR